MNAETPEAGEIDDIFRCLVPANLLTFLGRERATTQLRLDELAVGRGAVGAVALRADRGRVAL